MPNSRASTDNRLREPPVARIVATAAAGERRLLAALHNPGHPKIDRTTGKWDCSGLSEEDSAGHWRLLAQGHFPGRWKSEFPGRWCPKQLGPGWLRQGLKLGPVHSPGSYLWALGEDSNDIRRSATRLQGHIKKLAQIPGNNSSHTSSERDAIWIARGESVFD
jgi:hypothetical protein